MPLKQARFTFIWITPHLPQKVSGAYHIYVWASLVAQLVESAYNEGDLGSIPGLGRSPGEGKGYSNILAWRIPWYSSWGCKELDMTERLSLSLQGSCIFLLSPPFQCKHHVSSSLPMYLMGLGLGGF